MKVGGDAGEDSCCSYQAVEGSGGECGWKEWQEVVCKGGK